MHARLLLFCLVIAAVSAHQASPAQATPHLIKRSAKLRPRQFADPFSFGDGDASTSTSDPATSTTPQSTSSSQSSTSSSYVPTSTSTTAPTSTSSSSSQRQKTTSYQSTFTATPTAITSSSTDSAGSVVLVTSTVSLPSSTSTSVALSSATQTSSSQSSSGGHTGLIIGVSVVGGVAIIGALIFLYMKFGGKRFSEYQDDDADIKWPELKAEGDAAALQPLPARRTGGAGFDMGNEFDDGQEGDSHSMTEYGNKGRDSMTASTTALNAGVGAGAPYAAGASGGAYGAGMDSNYHDDTPSATNHYSQQVAGYYDPYGTYPGAQSQQFYPEQTHEVMPSGQQYDGYQDYQNQSDPYGAARAQAASVSPPMQPYRVGGQSMHQGY